MPVIFLKYLLKLLCLYCRQQQQMGANHYRRNMSAHACCSGTWKCGLETHLASCLNSGFITFWNSAGSITSSISSSSFKYITYTEQECSNSSSHSSSSSSSSGGGGGSSSNGTQLVQWRPVSHLAHSNTSPKHPWASQRCHTRRWKQNTWTTSL